MNADSSIDKAKQKLKPVIDYFESIKQNYTSSSKHDRKMRYAVITTWPCCIII